MKSTYPLVLIAIFFMVSCSSTTPQEMPIPQTEKKPIGEFIDDWTFNVFPKTSESFDEAKFRLWLPEGEENIRAILVILSFYNGSSFGDITLEEWQTYAKDEKLGLLGVTLRGGNYADADMGSGEALIKAVDTITYKNSIPNIGKLPFLLKGYSAGGVFSYYFSHYKPERVIAFVNIRGGGIDVISNTNNNVPGVMLLAENDLPSRNQRMTNVVLSKRNEGGLYNYAIEPNADHFWGLSPSWRLTRAFFSIALSKRLSPETNVLNNINESSGWLGDNVTRDIYSFDNFPNPSIDASWLINQTFAEKWKAYQAN